MKIVKYLKDPFQIVSILKNHNLLNWMPDRLYLQLLYRQRMGYRLNLDNPLTFNEKIQWLKLYDRKPIYTTMVDKYKAKEYVAGIIGKEHIIPNLGVWNHFDEINFELLPDRFVLKCTHDSGGLVICKNKKDLDIKKARDKIEKSLRTDYYLRCREWPYRNVERKIIAEKFMEDEESKKTGIRDYKFFCFNGKPKFVYVSEGMDNHAAARMIFMTMDWKKASFQRTDYKEFDELPKKPNAFDEMVNISQILSRGLDFIRVDLYQIQNKVYFSELTFSPCAGFMPFKDMKSDLEIGKMLNLSPPKYNSPIAPNKN